MISVSDLSPFLKIIYSVWPTVKSSARKIMHVSFDYTEFTDKITEIFYISPCRKINSGGKSVLCAIMDIY